MLRLRSGSGLKFVEPYVEPTVRYTVTEELPKLTI